MSPVIVTGFDGSHIARRAVEHAARMARGGRLLIVHAYEHAPPHITSRWRELLEEDHRERARAVLDAVSLEAAEALAEVDWEPRLEGGAPAEALLRVAAEAGADAIVVGSHGYGAVSSLLGSVSQSLLRESDRPVTVIPPRCAERMGEGRAGASTARR